MIECEGWRKSIPLILCLQKNLIFKNKDLLYVVLQKKAIFKNNNLLCGALIDKNISI